MAIATLAPSRIRPSWKQGFARSKKQSAYPGLWEGLEGLWVPALGPTGDTLVDVSKRKGGNHGTLTAMDPATDWVSGDPRVGGYSLDFDGSDDDVPCPGVGANTGTELTVVVIVRQAALGTDKTPIMQGQYQAVRSWNWAVSTNGVSGGWRVFVPASIGDAGGNRGVMNNGTTAANVWYMLGFRFNGTGATDADRLQWIQDGSVQSFDIYEGTIPSQLAGGLDTLHLGKFEGLGRFWNGEIAYAAVYDRLLSACEIELLYLNPLAPLRRRRRVYAAAVVAAGALDDSITAIVAAQQYELPKLPQLEAIPYH